VHARAAQVEADRALGKPADPRPGWRILRGEVWRQYGTLIDVEKRFDGDRSKLVDYVAETVASSMVQQRERIHELADTRVGDLCTQHLSTEVNEDDWDYDALEDALQEQFGIEFELQPGAVDEIVGQVWPKVEERLLAREHELSRPWLMYFSRHFHLEEIDAQWIEHLKTMDALREGIGLQGYGQKDPKKEYKRIGYDMFAEMMGRIQANVTNKLFHVQMQREEEQVPVLQQQRVRSVAEQGAAGKVDEAEARARRTSAAAAAAKRGGPGAAVVAAAAAARKQGEPQAEEAGDDGDVAAKAETVRRERPKVGRNDPCPCGSGKKYKKCHGKDEAEASAES
jgi:preprotein translocase subunit SecA